MKRCPECRRDYHDDTLRFCLADGAELVYGVSDEPETAIIPPGDSASEAATRTFEARRETTTVTSSSKKNSIVAAVIGVALITALGVGSYFYYGRDSSNPVGSIAVMPFVNDSGNPDIEYLSDGVTESLINSLSQIPALSVKARSSVFSYKGKNVTPQQVAKDLSVEAVLNGHVTQRGDQVLLNIELVDAGTGNHLWGDQYVRKTSDLVNLQNEISRDVATKLRAKLTGAEQQRVSKSYTENTEAYRLYLLGRYHWNKRKPDDLRRSVEYFQQAIDKDPTYALAYAALAETYIIFPNYGVSSPKDAFPKARAAAAKAIEIDPELAEAHNAMATILSGYEWRFAEAEAEFRRAIDLNPNYATAHQWYAEHLTNMGRYQEALTEMRRAQELDPLSLIINGLLGITLHGSGQYDLALEQLQRTVEMDPNFPRAHFFLSTVYQTMGRYEDSVDEFARGVVLNGAPADRVAAVAAKIKNAARTDGERGYYHAMAEALTYNTENAPPPAPFVASCWVRAGEVDKGFEVLEKAYRERDDSILLIKGPGLDPVKSDPRYKDLLRRIGLPE